MVQIRNLSSCSTGDSTHDSSQVMAPRMDLSGAQECRTDRGSMEERAQKSEKAARRKSPRGADVTAPLVFPSAKELFRRFLLLDKLGQGSFGKVWKCVDRTTEQEFACKQMPKSQGVASLLAEVECLTRVQGHPNVLALEGVFESELYLYVVTELCNSGDLFEQLMVEGAMTEEEARRIFREVTAAVHHCHTRGVIHRDIKPENVLLCTSPTTGRMTAKLADFGLAKLLRGGEKTVGWVGSEPYEAPEVKFHRPYDFSADVFSLGVLLFGLLSANWPQFSPTRELNIKASFSWPGWKSISGSAKDLIERMLSVNPHRRPTPGEVLDSDWLSCTHEAAGGLGERGSPSPGELAPAEHPGLEEMIRSWEPLALSRTSSTSRPQTLALANLAKVSEDHWSGPTSPAAADGGDVLSPLGSELNFSWVGSSLSSASAK